MTARRHAVLGLLLVGLVGLALTRSALTAPPGPPGPTLPFPVKVSDLAVSQVRLSSLTTKEFPSATLHVRIKNLGSKDAPPSPVVVCYTTDVGASNPFLVYRKDTPVIPAGAEASVSFFMPNVGNPWRTLLIAAVDVPVAGHPAGQLTELSELNNVFGFTFDTSKFTLPKVWDNPAVD